MPSTIGRVMRRREDHAVEDAIGRIRSEAKVTELPISPPRLFEALA